MAADHLVMTTAIENFRRLFAGERSTSTAQEVAALYQLLGGRLREHFAYEERTVFPALLAEKTTPDAARLITELTQEHGGLVSVADQLQGRLGRLTVAQWRGEAWLAMLDFLTALTHHCVKEEELLRLYEPPETA